MYNGGKNGSGTYQQIINFIPPHDIYFELFAGSASIYFNKLPAGISILSEVDTRQVAYLKSNIRSSTFVICADSIQFLSCWNPILNLLHASGRNLFMYLDPPYLFSTRSCQKRLYSFELTELQHIVLLDSISHLQFPVMISAYKNDLYDSKLNNWHTHSFSSKCRTGMRTETIYMNYPKPERLHDYSYLGTNFKQRQLIKQSIHNTAFKINSMPVQERNALFQLLGL